MALVMALGLTAGVHHAAFGDSTVRTNTDAHLRARPGERAPTLAHIPEGQAVHVLGQEGRWLKVSFQGKTGYITRTQVDNDAEPAAAARETPAPKRARSTASAPRRKGWSGDVDGDSKGSEVAGDDQGDDDSADEAPAPKKAPPKKAAEKPAPAPKKVAKKTTKKSKKAVAKRAPLKVGAQATITAETSVRQRPSAKGEELYVAGEGETMKVISLPEDGKWVRVQDDSGTKGWVMASAIASNEPAADASDEDDDAGSAKADDDDGGDTKVAASDDGEDEEAPRVHKKGHSHGAKAGALTYSIMADVGVLAKTQTFSSAGTGIRANYGLSNTAPTLLVGGLISKPYGSYEIGANASYYQTVGGSGISVADPTAGTTTALGWKANGLDARVVGGYHTAPRGGYILDARVGYHLESTTVDVSTVAKLPSERLSGPTVGFGIEAPWLTPTIGVRINADMLISGKLDQTTGLKDGTTATAAAYYLNAVGSYRWKSNIDVTANYTLAYEGFAFAGTDDREMSAAGGTRKDLQHVLTAGINYKF